MLTVVVHYLDSRSPAMTMTNSEVMGDSDLPELASRLVHLLPAAKRVQIFDDDRPVADTDVDERGPESGDGRVTMPLR